MFAVIATFQPNFVEKVISRHATAEEARAAAAHFWAHQRARVVRVWVRQERELRANH